MSLYPVAALYVDPKGPYPQLATDWYDETRDATTYSGPHRVIAHPPCGPWGKLKHFCKKQHERRLAVVAVEQVRRYGGVLEHPEYSELWTELELPPPGFMFPDAFGGVSYVIAQGDFGHVAPKLTWLYAVGLTVPSWIKQPQGNQRGRVELQHSSQRHFTPPQLAELLCQWVAQ